MTPSKFMSIEFQTRRRFLKVAGVASSLIAFNRVYGSDLTRHINTEKFIPQDKELRGYTGLLRLYDEFDSMPDKRAPRFKYDFSNPELKKFREKYQLYQIAGTGDGLSKAKMVMKWMKEHVSYRADIASALPEVCKTLPMNASGLLEYSFDKGKSFGVNCYMHAIILTEACLSIGLKSRIISLNPLNPFDYDNHLVSVIWCENLSKWVMLDPSYNGYVYNDKGESLNPWEIRDLLCRDQTVLCNDELDFNGKTSNSQDYLRYLAKNLFYMHSPTFYGFDSTTTSEKPWLALSPKHFDVCKREVYNMKWRAEANTGKWQKGEFEKIAKEECGILPTFSIKAFSQSPL